MKAEYRDNEKEFLDYYVMLRYAMNLPSQGNMTAGTDGKTIDAMSMERIDRLIAALKDESYKPFPSRRVYIPKKNGKKRPLGIPSVDDKLVQETVRMILSAIYENSFEDVSHGFRPSKRCHTALRQIQNRFVRCKWFVEGDIKGFFDNIEHEIMIKADKSTDETERTEILAQINELDIQKRRIPCKNPMDSSFKRLQYVRYADDFIIGIIGSKADAEKVKADAGVFIMNMLKLEMSDEKTLITKATDKARFLGYDIRVTPQKNQYKRTKNGVKARSFNGHIQLEVPTELIRKKLLSLEAMKIDLSTGTEIWKPVHRGKLAGREDLSILDQYNGEARGLCNYYSIANNRSKLHKFRYIMEYSMYKTFAFKYRTTKAKIIEKYRINKDFGIRYKAKDVTEKNERSGKAVLRMTHIRKEQRSI